MRFLFALFIIVPLIEMIILIKVGGVIGALPTVILVCLTAIIGVALIKAQGRSTMLRAQQNLQAGQLPADALLDGVCLLLGGAMLLTPGFATDAFGFLLLVPGLRRRLFATLVKRFSFQAGAMGPNSSTESAKDRAGPSTLEGEFWREK